MLLLLQQTNEMREWKNCIYIKDKSFCIFRLAVFVPFQLGLFACLLVRVFLCTVWLQCSV